MYLNVFLPFKLSLWRVNWQWSSPPAFGDYQEDDITLPHGFSFSTDENGRLVCGAGFSQERGIDCDSYFTRHMTHFIYMIST